MEIKHLYINESQGHFKLVFEGNLSSKYSVAINDELCSIKKATELSLTNDFHGNGLDYLICNKDEKGTISTSYFNNSFDALCYLPENTSEEQTIKNYQIED